MASGTFSLTITDAFVISDRSVIVTGKVTGAPVRINDRILITGGGKVKEAVVKGVEVVGRLDVAGVGEDAGLLLREVGADDTQVGFVLTHASAI